VYAVPFVRPETVIGDAPVPVRLPGVEVAVYVTPPEPTAPAVYATVAEAFPAVAVPIVGADGLIPGVCELDASDAGEVTPLLVAVTVNVYAVPAVRPVTVIGEEEPVPVRLPGLDVTVYVVVLFPP
jgi:hypothetical protein